MQHNNKPQTTHNTQQTTHTTHTTQHTALQQTLKQKFEEKMSSQYLLAEFALPITIEIFCNLFFYSSNWYEIFLSKHLNDLNIVIGPWSDCKEMKSQVREITSHHPSKVSFPGLPSHAGFFFLFFYYFLFF